MEEYRENIGGGMPQYVKWLKILFWVQIVSAAVGLLSNIPGLDPVGLWLGYGMEAALFVVLFQMSAVNRRYRKAAVLTIVSLACLLLNTLLIVNLPIMNFLGTLVTLAASLCAIIAGYQEYYGHAEMIEPLDRKLAGKWHSLFVWEIVLGLLGGFASMVTTLVLAFTGGAEIAATVVVLLINGLSIVIRVIYLVLIGRMIGLLEKQQQMDL